MKNLILLAVIIIVMTACTTVKYVPVVVQQKSDSTTIVVSSDTFRYHDTVYYNIPATYVDTVCLDSSWLENDYAISKVWIDKDNQIHHSLTQKDNKLPIPVTTTLINNDSVINHTITKYNDSPPSAKHSDGRALYIITLITVCLIGLALFLALKKKNPG